MFNVLFINQRIILNSNTISFKNVCFRIMTHLNQNYEENLNFMVLSKK